MRLHPFLEHGGVIAIAQRGGALEEPENTMRAFEAAIRLGYRYLATDARATADGVVIAFCDDTLDRLTELRGAVGTRSHAELAQLRIGGTEPIARLEDVLVTWPDARLCIEVGSDAVVEPLARLLRVTGSIERVCLSSGSKRRLDTLREIFGERLCTALDPDELASLRFAYFGWLTPVKAAARCVRIQARTLLGGVVPWQVSERFLARAHRHNLPVYVEANDERERIETLLDLGVDGIITDRPSALASALEERGLWWRETVPQGKRRHEPQRR
jgi:glycerophosphoryl diester phosphodiesterase